MISIKPLSTNKAWKGRRFKTDAYKAYEMELTLKLPSLNVPNGKLRIDFTFYFSNPLSDIDNSLKQTIDVMQKKYKFNDKNIYELNVKKVISTNEGIDFQIYSLE